MASEVHCERTGLMDDIDGEIARALHEASDLTVRIIAKHALRIWDTDGPRAVRAFLQSSKDNGITKDPENPTKGMG